MTGTSSTIPAAKSSRSSESQEGLPRVTEVKLPSRSRQTLRAVTFFGSIGCPVPCYQQECPDNLCMKQIRVERVLKEVENLIGLEPV